MTKALGPLADVYDSQATALGSELPTGQANSYSYCKRS